MEFSLSIFERRASFDSDILGIGLGELDFFWRLGEEEESIVSEVDSVVMAVDRGSLIRLG